MPQDIFRPLILCVDNRAAETQRELFRRVLEKAGYRVLMAVSAHAALEIFRQNQVDLVLTEHIAPTTTQGPTLAAIMKGIKPDVPVALYSADLEESPDDMQSADIFISKLLSRGEFLSRIVQLLQKGPTRAAE
jgi:CheY-like chemotaxis protein